MAKPSVILIGDHPGWAFYNIISFVKKYLSKEYDIYYDYLVYKPRLFDLNKESSKQIKSNLLYRKKIPFKNIPVARGLTYRFTKAINKKGLFETNEEGKYQRLRKDNNYDIAVFLDYYMLYDGDFQNIKADKIIQGSYSDVFPPRKNFLHPETGKEITFNSKEEFYQLYLKNCDAFLAGAPSIKEKYESFVPKPVFFANMAYNEDIFKPYKKQAGNKKELVIGWTGNPERDFKGFRTIIEPTIKNLQKNGIPVKLITQFQGSLNSLAKFWQKADLAIIASEADAGPSMFMEASLCGVPSISTKIGMPHYVIKDQINGIFSNRTIEDFSDKIEFIYHNRDLLRKMKNSIRNDYIEKLGTKVQIDNWRKMFQTVLNEK